MDDKAVTVMIAAFNAQDTVGCAVKSALREGEVKEVILVDDCSLDGTVEAALSAAEGDKRLRMMRQTFNQGPAAARNLAIAASSQPFVAILDADDRFLPGRFSRIFAHTEWDFCADNVLFAGDERALEQAAAMPEISQRSGMLDLEAFVAGNHGPERANRSELGFLKPVMRREFLQRWGLTYDVDCRLGEDFLFYARALAHGARFRVLEACGYAALERPDSLSGRHRIEDLAAFRRGIEEMSARPGISSRARKALLRLRKATHEKVVHREVLDIRRKQGVLAGMAAIASRPTAIRDIFRDKFRSFQPPAQTGRLLVGPADFERSFL